MSEDQAQAEHSNETAGGNPPAEEFTAGPEAAPSAEAQSPAPERFTPPAPSAEPAPEPKYEKGSVEEYEAELQAALDAAPEGAQPAPAEEPGPRPEESAEAAPEAAPETAAPAAETTTEEDDVKIPERVRLSGLSDKSKAKTQAAILLAKAEGIEVDEAMARLNGTPPARETAPAPPPVQVRREEAIKADIDALKNEKKEAAQSLDTIKMMEIDERIEALRDEMNESRRAQSEQFATFQRTVEQTVTRATELYPDLAVQGSEFEKGVIAMADRLEAQGNPVVHQPDALLKVAQMYANEQGIAPKAPGAKTVSKAAPAANSSTTQAKPKAVPPKAVGRPQTSAVLPASGTARTNQTGPPAVAQTVEKLSSQYDYDKLVQELANA